MFLTSPSHSLWLIQAARVYSFVSRVYCWSVLMECKLCMKAVGKATRMHYNATYFAWGSLLHCQDNWNLYTRLVEFIAAKFHWINPCATPGKSGELSPTFHKKKHWVDSPSLSDAAEVSQVGAITFLTGYNLLRSPLPDLIYPGLQYFYRKLKKKLNEGADTYTWLKTK